jgi:ABC-2 type transport system permease protein
MKSHRIKALVLRHLYPVIRDFDLLSDMVYWPVIDTILWGVTSQWLSESSGNMQIVLTILIALVLWNVIWRSQAEVSRNLMDEIWNKNLVNIFSTPLKLKEWVTAVLLLSVLKTAITLVLLVPVMYLMYTVNVFQLGWWLLVFFLGCLITGWWVGFISAGIVLRYGQKMQTVVWTLPGILLPFSAIYYPVDKLPEIVQPISLLIPTTYIFESMRSLLAGNGVDLMMMVVCFGLNFLWLAITLWYFVRSYQFSKNLGLGRL